MKSSSTFLNDSQRQAVEAAIADAESRTSAEVVAVIAAASGRYDRAEDIAGLWLGSLAMAALWIFWPAPAQDTGEWGAPVWLHYLGWLAALGGGFVAGAVLASRINPLRRLFTPRREMLEEVQARARAVFFDQRVHRTAGGTGLLVYVSVSERMACILADEPVHEALTQPVIDGLCRKLTAAMGEDPGTALGDVIQEAGTRLAEALPRQKDDTDELPNTVIFLD